MMSIASSLLILLALGVIHLVYGPGCWGFQAGGHWTAGLFLIQLAISGPALLYAVHIAGSQRATRSRTDLVLAWIAILMGAVAFWQFATVGGRMLTSIQGQGPENLPTFLATSLVAVLVGCMRSPAALISATVPRRLLVMAAFVILAGAAVWIAWPRGASADGGGFALFPEGEQDLPLPDPATLIAAAHTATVFRTGGEPSSVFVVIGQTQWPWLEQVRTGRFDRGVYAAIIAHPTSEICCLCMAQAEVVLVLKDVQNRTVGAIGLAPNHNSLSLYDDLGRLVREYRFQQVQNPGDIFSKITSTLDLMTMAGDLVAAH